ncbi:MAG: hypothetical protein K1X44_07115 [Alphaproteobacteria bacterium]|nr:hypothetical protein [Alphaproteobacteria bacterium]
MRILYKTLLYGSAAVFITASNPVMAQSNVLTTIPAGIPGNVSNIPANNCSTRTDVTCEEEYDSNKNSYNSSLNQNVDNRPLPSEKVPNKVFIRYPSPEITQLQTRAINQGYIIYDSPFTWREVNALDNGWWDHDASNDEVSSSVKRNETITIPDAAPSPIPAPQKK